MTARSSSKAGRKPGSQRKPKREPKPEPESRAKERRAAREPPLPGRAVRGSTGGRPIMAALDLLGRRWILRILWELREGAVGFRELRARCDDMSPDTLSTRLHELEAARLAERDEARSWSLTETGRRLGPALESLDRWAEGWADALREEG